MTSHDIRNSFLQFFKERGHAIVPSSPVVPYDDPTLLFTNAGMNQFKDVFLGTGTRDYKRAADTQKCIRVSGKHNDLEEVGRDTYHHTFFEMLGNWSFGDPARPAGGYYKKEAIEWAWELLTNVWGLEKKRLWATVYKDDEEAAELWKKVTDIEPGHILRFDEKDNFWEMGETGPCGPCSEIHYDWTPNATADASMINAGTPDVIEIWNLVFIQYNAYLEKEGEEALIEWDTTPWDAKDKLKYRSREEIISKFKRREALPQKHVDTGMGFERICAVLQNKKSNYDTDVFTPIIAKICELTGKKYRGSLDSNFIDPRSQVDVAVRVIADHIRMLTFSIADGGTPSNKDRGSVIRQVLRRAATFGRHIGMDESFLYKIVGTVVQTMGEQFPEIKSRQAHIEEVIKSEEESYNKVFDKGFHLFHVKNVGEKIRQYYIRKNKLGRNWWVDDKSAPLMLILRDPSVSEEIVIDKREIDRLRKEIKKESGIDLNISGEEAFELRDTHGVPLDFILMWAQDLGLKVDIDRFNDLMEKQRERSRSYTFITPGTGQIQVTGGDATLLVNVTKDKLEEFVHSVGEPKSSFIGYDELATETNVVKGDRHLLILEETPFYAESGGQVGDQGVIEIEGNAFKVYDTQKSGDLNVHILESPAGFMLGEKARAQVDKQRRYSIMRNHTATHLVHAALRKILGTHVHQSGSFVAPDHLRFDFAHFSKVSDEELADIETLVNEKIQEDIKLTHHHNIPFEEAKKMGALMFFGDKYGDRVNVVEFGEFSKEFCGGTHVKSTSDIGYFKFRHEGSVASGVRRIEAVTADYALELLKLQDKSLFDRLDYAYQQLDEISTLQQELKTLSNGKSPLAQESITDVERKLEAFKQKLGVPGSALSELQKSFDERTLRSRQLEDIILFIADKKKSLKKELEQYRLKSLSSNIDALIQSAIPLNGLKLVTAKVPATSMDELKLLGDTLRAKLGRGVGVLAAIIDDKVSLVCVVTDDLVAAKKLDAGKVVGVIAKLVGGDGGGRPHWATAGGKDIAKLDEALQSTASIVKNFLM